MLIYPDLNDIDLDLELDTETKCSFKSGLTFGDDIKAQEQESYTFETHPFYAQLDDFSNADFPDKFKPAGELF